MCAEAAERPERVAVGGRAAVRHQPGDDQPGVDAGDVRQQIGQGHATVHRAPPIVTGSGKPLSSAVSTFATAGSTGASSPGWPPLRSEEHTSELQSLMRISYAVFCLKKKKYQNKISHA